LAGSARDYRANHHERKDHEQQDQAQFRVVRHVMLRAGSLPLLLRCNHMPDGVGWRVTRFT